MTVLTTLEEKTASLACKVFNCLADLRLYLRAGSQKTAFGMETDRLLSKMPEPERKKQIKSFQEVFRLSSKKLEDHLDNHPAYAFHKAARIFDPWQLVTLL